MLEQIIEEHFENIGHTWTIGGEPDQTITDSDIEKVLDEAVKHLYNESIGTRFNIGGLIIEKNLVGYSVYAYMGHYI